MSYEIIKSFKADRKNLIIKATYQVNNVTDYLGNRITEVYEKQYDNKEEFEKNLLVWADSYLSGCAKFYPSMTFAKRVEWLCCNGYSVNKSKDKNWVWHELIDKPLVRKVLSGELKTKNIEKAKNERALV